MKARELAIGPGLGYAFETGARFFAALAFPLASENVARCDAEQAWCADYMHQQNKLDEVDLPFEDPKLNRLASHSEKWIRSRLRTARRRVFDRNETARAVRPWVSDLAGLVAHPTVPGIKKFTHRQIALWLCDNDLERAVRFQERVWRPTRAVLHYAVAVDEILLQIKSAGHADPRDFEPALLNFENLAAFELIIKRGEWLAPRIADDPRFGIAPSQQLRLIWQD